MKPVVLGLVLLVALPLLLAPVASAIPPVCLEKHADAAGSHVEVWVTCGVRATGTVCPQVEPCVGFNTDDLP